MPLLQQPPVADAQRGGLVARRRFSWCGALLIGLLPVLSLQPARAEGAIDGIVRGFCLSAFENEMSQAGKKPPQGMAEFACGCVVERLQGGMGLDAARQTCRSLTARRYAP